MASKKEFKACFPFIRNDILLCAVVEKDTGKQRLVMVKLKKPIDLTNKKKIEFENLVDDTQYKNVETMTNLNEINQLKESQIGENSQSSSAELSSYIYSNYADVAYSKNNVEFSESIECIHTAVIDISAEDLDKLRDDPDFQEKTLYIRSSEELIEFYLEPQEKFKAFKSWVAGIAEAGLNAFKIQSEIEEEANLVFPIVYPLMKFLIKIDVNLIYEYMEIIQKECVFEGVRHESSLIANLEPIVKIISENPKSVKSKQLLSALVEINPPTKLFTLEEKYYDILEDPFITKLENLADLFKEDSRVKYHLLKNPAIKKTKEYTLFMSFKTEPDPLIRQKVAGDPDSASLEFGEFRNFLSYKTEPNYLVRVVAASNPNAVRFKEDFKNFLSYKTEPNNLVRKKAASRKDIFEFPESLNFFSFKTEPDPSVRKTIAKNIMATKLKQYQNFLSYKTEPNHEVRLIAILNPLVWNFKKFKSLVNVENEPDPLIRDFVGLILNLISKESMNSESLVLKLIKPESLHSKSSNSNSLDEDIGHSRIGKEKIDYEKINIMEILNKILEQRNKRPIRKKDFDQYAQIKQLIEFYKRNFEEDYKQYLILERNMSKWLFPPNIELDDELERELNRLKKITKPLSKSPSTNNKLELPKTRKNH
ncbi:MAG: hypothetical protein ACTSRZ_08255 [Promethearchaeota archaeon]